MACLNENDLMGVVHRTAPADVLTESLRHIDGCPSCHWLMTQLVREDSQLCTNGSGETFTEPPGPPTRGSRLGRYVVLELIGAGGMGWVYSAFDPQLERKVALKLLSLPDERAARDFLLQEARAAAQLTHPHVVTVFDVGMEGEQAFVAMELVEGGTARSRLRGRPWREVLNVYLRAGEGLAAAHRQGVIHRDFKPDNVLVGDDDSVRVTDFGLALRSPAQGPPVISGQLAAAPSPTPEGPLGTPAYMAPEQRRGGDVDARADQYSFCAALCEALLGERPSGLPLRRKPGIPRGLLRALERGLSEAPASRFGSMNELMRALSGTQRQRNRLRNAGAVLAVMGALSPLVWHEASRYWDNCEAPLRQLDRSWNGEARAALRERFAGMHLPFAAPLADRVVSALDRYADAWRHGSSASCLRETHGARVLCLEESREAFVSLIQVLRTADAKEMEVARQAVAQLPDVEECMSGDRVLGPQVQDDRLSQARALLAQARSSELVGRYAHARGLAESARRQAGTLGSAQVAAEAWFELGTLDRLETKGAAAESDLLEATWAAEAAGNDRIVVRSAAALAELVASRSQQDALKWRRLAESALERLGRPPLLAAEVLEASAEAKHAVGAYSEELELLLRAEALRARQSPVQAERLALARTMTSTLLFCGRPAEALRRAQQSLDQTEAILGADHPQVALQARSLASVLREQDLPELAEPLYRRALDTFARTLGRDNLRYASVQRGLALVVKVQNRFEEALALEDQVLTVQRRWLRADDPALLDTRSNRASTLRRLNRFDEAYSELMDVLAIRRRTQGDNHPDVAWALGLLGDFSRRLGCNVEALRFHSSALALEERTLGVDNLELAWDLTGMGEARLAAGESAKAVAPLTRALALRERAKAGAGLTGRTRFDLAKALWTTDRAQALQLLARTEAALPSGQEADELRADLQSWKAKPGLRPATPPKFRCRRLRE